MADEHACERGLGHKLCRPVLGAIGGLVCLSASMQNDIG